MHASHDDMLAGHFGEKRMLELIQHHYHWPGMEKDIRKRVRTCASCQFSTPRWHCPYGELQPLPVPQGAWQELTMNFITDLPPSRMRNGVFDSILVIVNRYLKMVSYIPAKKTWKAKDLADTFIERVISCFGPPKGIISD